MLLLNERILFFIRAFGGVYIATIYYALEVNFLTRYGKTHHKVKVNIVIYRHLARPMYYYSLLQRKEFPLFMEQFLLLNLQ